MKIQTMGYRLKLKQALITNIIIVSVKLGKK